MQKRSRRFKSIWVIHNNIIVTILYLWSKNGKKEVQDQSHTFITCVSLTWSQHFLDIDSVDTETPRGWDESMHHPNVPLKKTDHGNVMQLCLNFETRDELRPSKSFASQKFFFQQRRFRARFKVRIRAVNSLPSARHEAAIRSIA